MGTWLGDHLRNSCIFAGLFYSQFDFASLRDGTSDAYSEYHAGSPEQGQPAVGTFQPPSAFKAARQMLEKIQFDAIRKSLAELDGFKKFYIWNVMLSRQINTMKVQLYYQLREYSKVDELLPKAILFDPQSLAIKLARMYKNDNAAIDKFFKLKCRRFKGENGAFLASVYAWIKIKQEKNDMALEALRYAAKTSDNQILRENIDRLVNGKVKHYSNSGFGDTWYVLALEEPKVKNQRQMRAF